MFATWSAYLPPDVEILAVQYPGRQDRFGEKCIDDMDEMADTLAAVLRPLCDRPMTLFGHSMGSVIAYEVALRLERDLNFVMERLFVSARTTPHRLPKENNHPLSDHDLVAAIRQLGGADAQVYEVPNLWPVILPPLRADLRLLDQYLVASLERLRCPITAFGGASDHTCSTPDLAAWQDATAAAFDLQTFPGGHHYLGHNESAIVTAIADRITASQQAVLPSAR